MADRPYFNDYLDFLRVSGQRLAAAFPRAAERLARTSLDPDVERMLEGIAFLASNIEEKHDHGLGDVCQLFLDLLFPHYMAHLPSAAIVELDASRAARLPAGSSLISQPISGTPCTFRTLYQAEVGAFAVHDVRWRPGKGKAALFLDLMVRPNLPAPDSLTIHFHGEPLVTRSLYHWLLTQLEGIRLLGPDGMPLALSSGLRLKPLGFAPEQALFPYPECSFDGFRLLQEYFALPAKFLFVQIEGLGAALGPLLSGIPQLTISFDLKADVSRSFAISRSNIRVGCTPAVNLFEHTADPVMRNLARLEYMVRPTGPHGAYQIYRVSSVTGASRLGRRTYPLLSELDLDQAQHGFCQLHRRQEAGLLWTYVSLNDGQSLPVDGEVLLFDCLCSNGQLPLGLRVGDVLNDIAETGTKASLLTTPTPAAAVGVGPSLPARLTAHLALAQLDLTACAALRDLVTLYNWHALGSEQAARACQLLQQSILSAETKLVQHNYHRVPIWGHSTLVTLDEPAFDSVGEMYLFGCVMNEVIALQAPVNTFTEFAIRGSRTQEMFRWPRRLGPRLLEPSSTS